MNEKLKTTKIHQLRIWVWEITGKLSEEIFLLGSIERGSIVYSITIIILHKVPTAQSRLTKIQGRRKIPKYLEKSYYHHIKCIVPTFMAVFMWSRLLNNVFWEITTQEKLKKKCDRTNTQVMA